MEMVNGEISKGATMSEPCRYEHRQRGWLHLLLLGLAAVTATFAASAGHHDDPNLAVLLIGLAMLFFAVAFCFVSLTIRDESDRLAVRFGPIPLFRTSIRYDEISQVEPLRPCYLTWGIHWTRQGWLWNIHGFDCVRIVAGRRKLLLGTDDVAGLAAFLKERMPIADNS